MLDRWSEQVCSARRRTCESVEKCRLIVFSTDPMTIFSNYLQPKNIKETLQVIRTAQGPTRFIAGGTDLLLDLQQQRCPPVTTLVDVTSIAEMKCLEIRKDRLFIGAGLPLSAIAASALVLEHARALVEACVLIAGPQVRNVATLGGNVAHALPAADGAIALTALDAQVEIVNPYGNRLVSLPEIYAGPGESTLEFGIDLLVGFYLPLAKSGSASAFARIMRPQGVALPIINLAAWLQRENERITDVRIAVGPSGKNPHRAVEVEAVLRQKDYNPQLVAEADQVLVQSEHLRSSPHRASAAYRYALSQTLLTQVLETAWRRSGGDTKAGMV
jgi:xanthine dehydrogenase FAD-binding subunit